MAEAFDFYGAMERLLGPVNARITAIEESVQGVVQTAAEQLELMRGRLDALEQLDATSAEVGLAQSEDLSGDRVVALEQRLAVIERTGAEIIAGIEGLGARCENLERATGALQQRLSRLEAAQTTGTPGTSAKGANGGPSTPGADRNDPEAGRGGK